MTAEYLGKTLKQHVIPVFLRLWCRPISLEEILKNLNKYQFGQNAVAGKQHQWLNIYPLFRVRTISINLPSTSGMI